MYPSHSDGNQSPKKMPAAANGRWIGSSPWGNRTLSGVQSCEPAT